MSFCPYGRQTTMLNLTLAQFISCFGPHVRSLVQYRYRLSYCRMQDPWTLGQPVGHGRYNLIMFTVNMMTAIQFTTLILNNGIFW